MSDLLTVARITGVFGIKGWIKVHSQTEPADNVFGYQPWYLKTKHGVKPIKVSQWRPHGKGFVAQLEHIDDRNQAEALCPVDVAVEKSLLPDLASGEFYWHQLEGLRVISQYDGQQYDFGLVKKILPTGANDVLLVVGDTQSIDQKERLVPYVPEQFVKSIDLGNGVITVAWDPDF